MAFLLLLLFFEIIFFLIAFYFTSQDILSPSSTMLAMFIVSTVFAIASANNWNISYSLESCLILSSGLVVFLITEIIVKNTIGKQTSTYESSDYSVTVSSSWLIVFILFNVIVIIWYFFEIRTIVGSTSSIGTMFSTYRNMGVDDLAGVEKTRVSGLLIQLLKVVKASGYVGLFFIIDNILIHKEKSRSKTLLLIALCVLSLAPNVMVASRGGFLMFLSCALIIYYIMWHQVYGWNKSLSWKMMRIGLIAIVLGIPLFYYSAFLMGRKNSLNILEYVATYVGGSIQLFNLYLGDPLPTTMFGEETLFGLRKILNYLNLGPESLSYNLESRNLGGINSNVYTFFRRPLHDFGLLGMYLFTIVVSGLFSSIYYGRIKGMARSLKVDCWVLIYGYLFYWLIISSIEQYSVSYLSVGCLITILLILLLYYLLSRIRFVFR